MSTASLWKKERSLLEDDANNISVLKKQIIKETQIDVSVQQTIHQKIESLKKKGALLAKKLEQEKHKNVQLDTIIQYMKDKMEKDKISEATARDGSAFENMTNLDNKFKKLQYDLGHANSKVNKISQSVQEKKQKISQNRMQRVIDSGIFRNIEKQLSHSELTFKKLLIQEIKYQKDYEKLLEDYNQLKSKAQNLTQSTKTRISKKAQENTYKQQPSASRNNKFTQILQESNYHHSKLMRAKSIAVNQIDSDLEAQQQQKIMIVKKILIQIGLEKPEDLPESFESVQLQNQQYFAEITEYMDQINELEKYLALIQTSKQGLKKYFQPKNKQFSKGKIKSMQSKSLKAKISKQQHETDKIMQEISHFLASEDFSVFLKMIGFENSVQTDSSNFDELEDLLKKAQKQVLKYLLEITGKNSQAPTARTNGSERLEQIINKARKHEQYQKIMKKQDFQLQCQRIMKNKSQKLIQSLALSKKKSAVNLKKI